MGIHGDPWGSMGVGGGVGVRGGPLGSVGVHGCPWGIAVGGCHRWGYGIGRACGRRRDSEEQRCGRNRHMQCNMNFFLCTASRPWPSRSRGTHGPATPSTGLRERRRTAMLPRSARPACCAGSEHSRRSGRRPLPPGRFAPLKSNRRSSGRGRLVIRDPCVTPYGPRRHIPASRCSGSLDGPLSAPLSHSARPAKSKNL